MLRQAEELVMEARLELIAREHKSMGAVVDTRTLHPLEEIKFQTKKSLRLEIEKRLQGRRGGRAETDIKSKANLAVEAFKEKGINVAILTGNYELEQKIWRNKSSKRTYAQRRHLQHPELDEFLNSMSSNQVIEYQNRISQKLIEIVEKFRKECAELKLEMDLNGIFHPDANAQRVHCIYLMKLEKGISAANIEDPVLKEMYIEEYDHQCQQLDLQIKKQLMLKDLEDKEIQSTKRMVDSKTVAPSPEKGNAEGAKGENILSMMDTAEKCDKQVVDLEVLRSKIVKLKPFQEKITEKRDLSKSKWLPPLSFKKGKCRQRLSSGFTQVDKHSKSSPNLSDHAGKMKLESLEQSIRKRDDSESLDCNVQHVSNKPAPNSPSKLFSKKLKHERMGYMDPRSVLGEEAAKLDSAEPYISRKSFDKNPLLDDSLSKWMLSELQKTQIMKASSGGISNGTSRPLISSLVDEVPQSFATPGCFSPQKMLPFDEFYSLIKNISTNDYESHGEPRVVSESPHKLQGRLSGDENLVTPAKEDTAIASSYVQLGEPINIVRHLMEKDKHFDAFLKMNEREQPSSKLLEKLNANIMKPRRQRKVAQLGKEAVTLSNSRGQPSKMASKGFHNVFVPSVADAKDSLTENKAKVAFNICVVKEEISEPLDVIDRLLEDTKDGRRRRESTVGTYGEGNGMDEGPIKFPFYISKSKAGNMDAKVDRADALSFIKAEFRDCVDDSMFAFDDHTDIDMQSKLLACWEALSAPMHDRLSFMDKYSSSAYAAEMSRAVDMWSEVAVLITLLGEAISLHNKLEAGLMIFPVNGNSITKQLIRKIHPLLAASTPCLIPPAILYDEQAQSLPLSVSAMVSTRDLIRNTLSMQNAKNDKLKQDHVSDTLHSAEDARAAFAHILSNLSNELLWSLKRCHRELEDVVPFGHSSCKEWVLSLQISRVGIGK